LCIKNSLWIDDNDLHRRVFELSRFGPPARQIFALLNDGMMTLIRYAAVQCAVGHGEAGPRGWDPAIAVVGGWVEDLTALNAAGFKPDKDVKAAK
jgi:hypothetical protein